MALVNRTDPFDFVLFGATGDLSRRKLLPAFLRRFMAQEFDDDARIICVARSNLTTEEFRDSVISSLREFAPEATQDKDTLHRFLGLLTYIYLDATKQEANWDGLRALLPESPRARVFYLATAPSLFSVLCQSLAEQGLVTPTSRVVLEKPIGTSLATAQAINTGVGRYFPEESIYRIDHYLG